MQDLAGAPHNPAPTPELAPQGAKQPIKALKRLDFRFKICG